MKNPDALSGEDREAPSSPSSSSLEEERHAETKPEDTHNVVLIIADSAASGAGAGASEAMTPTGLTTNIPAVAPTQDLINQGLDTKGYITVPEGGDGSTAYKLVVFADGDPGFPQNWSKGYRWYLTMAVASTCFCVALGSSIVTGDFEGVMRSFNVSREVAILTICMFVLGFGLGPIVFAPASELWGRQVVYIATLSVAVIFVVPCAVAKNIETLVICRLIDGIAFSAPMTLVGGTLADLWTNEERGPAMAAFSAAPFIGPALGPIIGGFIGEKLGWRWLYYVYLMFSGFMLAVIAFTVPETHPPTILKRRAARLRREAVDASIKAESELQPLNFREIARTYMLRPGELLIKEPIVLFITLYMSVVYGIIYMFFFAYPIVFQEMKGYSRGIGGLCFIGIAVGVVSAGAVSPWVNQHYLKIRARYVDLDPPPEIRLIPMMTFCWFMPVGLFIFGWTSYRRLIWVGPVLAGFPIGFSFIMLYNAANNYLVDSYQDYAASVMAAKTFVRSVWGAGITLFTTQMFHRLGCPWASSLLGFLSLLCCLIPYVFYFYGARIRAMSKFTKSFSTTTTWTNGSPAPKNVAESDPDPKKALEP